MNAEEIYIKACLAADLGEHLRALPEKALGMLLRYTAKRPGLDGPAAEVAEAALAECGRRFIETSRA